METGETAGSQTDQGLAGRAMGIKAGFTAGSALVGTRGEQIVEAQKCHSWQRLLEICSPTSDSPWAAACTGTDQPDFCLGKASRGGTSSPSTRAWAGWNRRWLSPTTCAGL